MPLIEISYVEGPESERLSSMLSAVTDAVVESLDVPRESVNAIARPVASHSWALAGTTLNISHEL